MTTRLRLCSVDGCGRNRGQSRGLCQTHDRRVEQPAAGLGSNLIAPIGPSGVPDRLCSIEGCSRKHLCRLHYNRRHKLTAHLTNLRKCKDDCSAIRQKGFARNITPNGG